MLRTLSQKERLQLMRFVCSFAWADLEVKGSERKFIARMTKTLGLDEDEVKQVSEWLELPPRPEDIDPKEIPHAHRALFVNAARAVLQADGEVNPEESEILDVFEALVR